MQGIQERISQGENSLSKGKQRNGEEKRLSELEKSRVSLKTKPSTAHGEGEGNEGAASEKTGPFRGTPSSEKKKEMILYGTNCRLQFRKEGRERERKRTRLRDGHHKLNAGLGGRGNVVKNRNRALKSKRFTSGDPGITAGRPAPRNQRGGGPHISSSINDPYKNPS